MKLSETDVMSPIFLVLLIFCFAVVIPWVQARRSYRLRVQGGQLKGRSQGPSQIESERDFWYFDLLIILLILFLYGRKLILGIDLQKENIVFDLNLLKQNIAFQIGLAGFVLFRILLLGRGINRTLGLSTCKALQALFSALGLFVISFYVAVGFSVFGWQEFVQSTFGSGEQELVKLMNSSSDSQFKLWLAISAVVVAPICEEVVFRGYVFGVLRDFSGPAPAIVLSGLFFGLIHVNLLALPTLCFLGIGLAVIYHYTQNIWAPILCHFFFNSFTVLVQQLAPQS